MKSILMSIKPKWVEKIASGEKTVEVRKTVPKCGTPFKVYMYCTKAEKEGGFFRRKREILPIDDMNEIVLGTTEMTRLDGCVVGEFVCDCVTDFWADNTGFEAEGRDPFYMPCGYAKKETCLTNEQFVEYGKGAPLYGLHISDLKIYDKPKELSEFRKCEMPTGLRYEEDTLTRPPQSWCYVEEN